MIVIHCTFVCVNTIPTNIYKTYNRPRPGTASNHLSTIRRNSFLEISTRTRTVSLTPDAARLGTARFLGEKERENTSGKARSRDTKMERGGRKVSKTETQRIRRSSMVFSPPPVPGDPRAVSPDCTLFG